ncbi:MATE family efflux transporter [Candidatus Bipolaricaulota bacterium]|nr:MATE family efflux transporter [Candidatus Bipolaricaulota bacterium]
MRVLGLPARACALIAKTRLHPDRSRTVIRLAYPVVLGMISITLLNVVDTAMLGRLGADPLAAAGISAVGYFAIVFSLAGIGIGVQTLTARRYGEKKYRQCGEVLNAGLLLALIAGIPFVAASGWIANAIAPLLSHDPLVTELGAVFLFYRFLGAPFLLFNMVYRGFFGGVGKTGQLMISAILVTVINILLNYLLIFGHGGFPKMGIAGAAIASTIATGIGTVYFLLVSLSRSYRVQFRPYRSLTRSFFWFSPIVRLSLPVIGQRMIGNGSFFAFFSIVARIGTLELAASSIIRSVIGLSIMPAIGIGVAAAALVGQNMGAKSAEQAEGLAWEGAKLAVYLMAAVGLLLIVFPRAIFSIYTADPAVIALGRIPLILLGMTQAFGGVALVIGQALQGAGNTRYVMLVELFVCSLLYLPLAYLLGLHLQLGIIGAWTGEFVYWLAIALLVGWKFKRGTWKKIRV